MELARPLGMRAVAESVETHVQVSLPRAAGCKVASVFLFGMRRFAGERLLGADYPSFRKVRFKPLVAKA